MFNIKMACPFCGKELTKGEKKRYETLIDHVDDPNRENYPLRDTWVCNCEKSKDGFWDMFGDYYSKHYVNENTNAIDISK